MRKLRAFSIGGSAPKPPGFNAFFQPEWDVFGLDSGDRLHLSPAFPAAEPVARVASQHCPIPSGSGRLSINHAVDALHEKAANGDCPLTLCLTFGVHRRCRTSHRRASIKAKMPTIRSRKS